MSLLSSILSCLFGDPSSIATTTTTTDPRIAQAIHTILTAPTTPALRKSLEDQIGPTNWTATLAQGIIHHLASAIQAGAAMAHPAAEALRRATNAATTFAHDHPAYVTLLALGVLLILVPWVLEAVGFAEMGVVEGSWAASWQRTYMGFVPKGALFGYFQRLGAKWHWM